MKKFLSLILALTLVVSLFTVNVMAASKARSASVSADKATGLAAGDTVVVSVVLDTTDLICGAQYILTYDKDVFAIDTTKGWKIGMKKYENFLDQDWFKFMNNSDECPWAAFVSAPTVTYAVDGEIFCSWAGQDGIDPEYAATDDVIGKYIFTVKDGAANGEYTFGLKDANSIDAGENSKNDWAITATTVTVGAAEEEDVVEVGGTTAAATNGVASADGSKTYDNAMAVSAAITSTTATEIGVVFAPKAWLGANELTAVLDGVRVAAKTGIVGGIATTLKAAIKDIPRQLNDKEFVMVTRAYAYDGATYTYADAAETTMLFTKTAE